MHELGLDMGHVVIVPVCEITAIEPVNKLTFRINDDEVCENCESDAMYQVSGL